MIPSCSRSPSMFSFRCSSYLPKKVRSWGTRISCIILGSCAVRKYVVDHIVRRVHASGISWAPIATIFYTRVTVVIKLNALIAIKAVAPNTSFNSIIAGSIKLPRTFVRLDIARQILLLLTRYYYYG